MMDRSHIERPNYAAIFVILGLLTVFEVGITYLGLPQLLLIIGLLASATTKALLVALYYMHLKFDSKIYLGIVVLPLVLASALAFFMIL